MRNKFSLSHGRLTTGDMGDLIPLTWFEALPNDSIQQSTSLLLRVAPLNAPVMHPVTVRIHHWFVPMRLIWEDWEDFITGGADGADASVHPTMAFTAAGLGQAAKNDLAAHLGVPIGVDATVNALPFRAYAKIWNEWYADGHLETQLTIDETDGNDTTTNTTLQQCAWEKDYFTSARPWEQLGSSITMPLAGTADVDAVSGKNNDVIVKNKGTDLAMGAGALSVGASGEMLHAGATSVYVDPTNHLVADLSSATGPDINEVREAFALQRYKEARARYGARYTEYLRYLGVKPADGRLDRPEYLGGGKQNISFSEVLQTGLDTDGVATIGVGKMMGHGISAVRSNRYRKYFDEHGIIMTLLSVRPKTMYFEGIPKQMLRSAKEDYYQKELEHIGQAPIYNKEIYAAHATPDGVFGYQDRYDEYRRCESRIAGDFMDSTMNTWHMARDFAADPTLNAAFVSANPTNRIYQDTAADQIYVQAYHSIQARRMLAAKSGSVFM